MAGARLSGNARVRDAKGAVLEDAGAQEGREVSRDEVVVILWVRFGKCLERLVGTQSIAWGGGNKEAGCQLRGK